jgi:hypothetical protein
MFDPGVPDWHFPTLKDIVSQHSASNFVSINNSTQKLNNSIDKKKIMTQEEILLFLHQHNYNTQEALEELKREGKSWHPTKPDFRMSSFHLVFLRHTHTHTQKKITI